MKRKLTLSIVCCAVAVAAMLMFSAGDAGARGPRGEGPVIYVTSQGLFYDSIIGPDLPPKGPFQWLEMGGDSGLMTEFGPGDPGYVGGRWRLETPEGTEYFSCPLLGPGRELP